jgi:hypothetical protein
MTDRKKIVESPTVVACHRGGQRPMGLAAVDLSPFRIV